MKSQIKRFDWKCLVKNLQLTGMLKQWAGNKIRGFLRNLNKVFYQSCAKLWYQDVSMLWIIILLYKNVEKHKNNAIYRPKLQNLPAVDGHNFIRQIISEANRLSFAWISYMQPYVRIDIVSVSRCKIMTLVKYTQTWWQDPTYKFTCDLSE